MTEPGTEAGRRLLDGWWPTHSVRREQITATVLAIEAEATTALREALRDANQIIEMTRSHLAARHPNCAYEALGVLNDSQRRALAAASDAVENPSDND